MTEWVLAIVLPSGNWGKGRKNPAFSLSYGGACRDRTADLYNAIVALSQLSYSPITRACEVSSHLVVSMD